MNGFDLVAHCMKAEGVSWLPCFPNNPLIESAARVGIRPVVFRQERGAINATDGYTRTTGGQQVGVYASQSGPGVENSFGGIAQAWGEAVPMVFFPGGHGLKGYDVEPNFSATRSYGSVTKLAVSIDRPDRTVTQVQRAFHVARQGRPGPTLVELHPDVLMKEAPENAIAAYRPSRVLRTAPPRGDVRDAVTQLLKAKDPVLWVGQGVLYAGATERLMEFVNLAQIPVITTMQGKSAFPDAHPLALGSANRTAPRAVWDWLARADTMLCLGSGLTRTVFGIDIPPGKFLIQSNSNPEDINKDYSVDLGLVGDADLTLELMIDELKAQVGEAGRPRNAALEAEIAANHAAWRQEWAPLLESDEAPVNPYRVINEIIKAVDPAETIVTHDAGNPRDQIMPFYPATTPFGYIGWGKTTHLGYGIPLVIGAKVAAPEKFCLNFMGDLAFGHTGFEIETAVRAQIPITTVVINNRTMGGYDAYMPTAMKEYGAGNQSGDYAGVAQALGARGIHVDSGAGVGPAITEARKANAEGEVVVIEVATRQETRFSWYHDVLRGS